MILSFKSEYYEYSVNNFLTVVRQSLFFGFLSYSVWSTRKHFIHWHLLELTRVFDHFILTVSFIYYILVCGKPSGVSMLVLEAARARDPEDSLKRTLGNLGFKRRAAIANVSTSGVVVPQEKSALLISRQYTVSGFTQQSVSVTDITVKEIARIHLFDKFLGCRRWGEVTRTGRQCFSLSLSLFYISFRAILDFKTDTYGNCIIALTCHFTDKCLHLKCRGTLAHCTQMKNDAARPSTGGKVC